MTDFRTHVSGIRKSTLRDAIPFRTCQAKIGAHMTDKILVGHALKNDFQALMFDHPKIMIRDTAKYRPFMKRRGTGTVSNNSALVLLHDPTSYYFSLASLSTIVKGFSQGISW